MSTPPPHNPDQWGSGQYPPEHQNNRPSWPADPEQPQQPETGGWGNGGGGVTYNADKFDDEADDQGDGRAPDDGGETRYEQALPGDDYRAGSYYPAQTGGYDAPVTGSHEGPPMDPYGAPRTDAYGAPPTDAYSAPPTDTYGAPQTDAYGAPPTGQYPPQTAGYPAQTDGFATPGAQPRQKSKKPLIIAGGAIVVVVAVVVGLLVFTGFDGIRNGKGEISNAQDFLNETKAQWEDELPTDGIEVSDQAACYYVLNDRDEITNEVGCGPARRASTGEGEVWDIYHFDVSGSGDSQKAENPGSLKASQKAPSGGNQLVTVEGDEPADDGLSIKEPPLPKADENGVWTTDEFVADDKGKSEDVKLDSDPRLVAPGAEVVVSSIAEYSQATINDELMQAAEGQKFVLITLSGSSGPLDESAYPELTLDLDGEIVSLDVDAASMSDVQLLASIPKDGDSALVLDAGGHPQSLSLADGKRVEDESTAQYYSDEPVPTVSLGQDVAYPGTASSAGDIFSLAVTLDEANLQPYTYADGWAPDGQVWLTINFTHSASSETAGSAYTEYKLDCMPSTVDGGTMEYCASLSGGTGDFVVAVPAGTTSVAVNLAFTLTASGGGLPDATVNYAASPVTVTF